MSPIAVAESVVDELDLDISDPFQDTVLAVQQTGVPIPVPTPAPPPGTSYQGCPSNGC